MVKALFGITLLLSFLLLDAQEAYDKAFKHYIYEMVCEGTISSVSGAACQKGDCRIRIKDPDFNVLLDPTVMRRESPRYFPAKVKVFRS